MVTHSRIAIVRVYAGVSWAQKVLIAIAAHSSGLLLLALPITEGDGHLRQLMC